MGGCVWREGRTGHVEDIAWEGCGYSTPRRTARLAVCLIRSATGRRPAAFDFSAPVPALAGRGHECVRRGSSREGGALHRWRQRFSFFVFYACLGRRRRVRRRRPMVTGMTARAHSKGRARTCEQSQEGDQRLPAPSVDAAGRGSTDRPTCSSAPISPSTLATIRLLLAGALSTTSLPHLHPFVAAGTDLDDRCQKRHHALSHHLALAHPPTSTLQL